MLPRRVSPRLLLLLRPRAGLRASRHGCPRPCVPPGLPVRLQQSPAARAAGGARGEWTLVDPSKLEENFVFPEYVPEPERDAEPSLSAELQRRQEEEERQRQLRDERLQRRLQQQQRRVREKRAHSPVGSPDPSVPASGVNCSGCGAELHCRDPSVPGYLPSEKYRRLEAQAEEGGLARAVCQRCWLLVHHQRALRVQVSREQYRELVRAALRRPGPALVLYLVDVFDLPDPLLPDLPDLLGPKQVLLLGNKVDLLPGDSPGYLRRLRERLWDECARAGLQPVPPKARGRPPGAGTARPPCLVQDVLLISAKTGFGVEGMISALQSSWRYRGDVYLVGSTNAGKSTLFNTLLQSDYCIAQGSDAIDRATISPWPGTTLNLLKFPISSPTPYRLFERNRRLKKEAAKSEADLSEQEQKHLNQMKKQGYLVGRVGRTFYTPQKDEPTFEFDADSLAFDMESEPLRKTRNVPTKRVELIPQELKDAHWFYDTPGIVKENCILNYLTEKEVKIVLPTHSIIPRTFVLKPGSVLFLGALGRLDYLQGNTSAWFSVVASNLLPVHITTLEKADTIYQKHAGQTLLQVPMGGVERMAEFPPLVSQDITLEGNGKLEAVADIKLSSAGWVAITSLSEDKLHLRGYTPQGTTLTIRQPPLLPHIVNVKGERIKKSVAYKTKRPLSLVDRLKSSNKLK